jgi:hypothetical protein
MDCAVFAVWLDMSYVAGKTGEMLMVELSAGMHHTRHFAAEDEQVGAALADVRKHEVGV